MRWWQPKDGALRVRRGFLWFPKTIKHVTRWWEYAEWEQEFNDVGEGSPWWDVRWVDV